jgi:hypothetical protein
MVIIQIRNHHKQIYSKGKIVVSQRKMLNKIKISGKPYFWNLKMICMNNYIKNIHKIKNQFLLP